MRFRLNITLTEEDFFVLNRFFLFETPEGKEGFQRNRMIRIILAAVVIALYSLSRTLTHSWTVVTTIPVLLFGLYIAIYMLRYRKSCDSAMKKHLKKRLDSGEPLYDPVFTLEFFDDKMVETTPSVRTERSYDAIRRIYVVGDQYIFIFSSLTSAHTLPLPQVAAQTDQAEFLEFLSRKCGAIEYR